MGYLMDAVIETERLILRAVERADAPRIVAIINDPGIARMTTAIPYPYSLADAKAFLAGKAQGHPNPGADLKIESRDGVLLGGAGVHWSEGAFPEIGYWLGRRFWGEGLATEAAIGLLGWVRRIYGCRAIMAGHFADNAASGRVLIKSGFLYTGEVQHRFSVSRAEVAATRMMIWLA